MLDMIYVHMYVCLCICICSHLYAMWQGRRREAEVDSIFIRTPHFDSVFNLFAVPTDFSSI